MNGGVPDENEAASVASCPSLQGSLRQNIQEDLTEEDYTNTQKGNESKGKFLCSAVSGPQACSKHLTLYFPDRPVQSDTISTSLGSIQPYTIINAQRLLMHISTTVYSQVLVYTAE